MNTGGLLATLLMLGLVLLVISLAVLVSEPRNLDAPRTREDPSDITRRLNPQGARGRGRAASGRGGGKG